MEQPDIEKQKMLDELMDAEPSRVEVFGREYKVGWLRGYACRKFSRIMLREKNDWKRNIKCAAVLLLGRKWRIVFCYAFYWRWLYYIRDTSVQEVLAVLDAGKKKVPQAAFVLCTMLATGIKDTMMTMTRQEAIQAAQAGGGRTA